jgi:hypothetical protein
MYQRAGISNDFRQEYNVVGKTVTHAEWLKEGERRFGTDARRWRFVCPACGRVQSPLDFRPYAEQGAEPKDAMYRCLGTYQGGQGCTADSILFRPVEVVNEQGFGLALVFAFADEVIVISSRR